MKTPEEMAEEYVWETKGSVTDAAIWLDGYQAAKPQWISVKERLADAHIVTGETSDGYHTFNDLYEHRILLFLAALKAGAFEAPVVCEDHYPDWDVITCYTPNDYAQISYHLPVKYRYLYKHLDRCSKEQQENNFDGHHSKLVAQRIEKSLSHTFLPTPAKWISVKDRLPSPGQEVLVFDNGIMRVQAISDHGTWHPYVNGARCNPSHWIELPAPPEEK